MSETRAAPVTYSADADGVGWIVFDDPQARANVFHPASLDALDAAISEAERSPIRAVVLFSGKERIFIAGADLKWLASLPDVAHARELSRRGQRLFQRLAAFRVPVVCAIHGACVGGGFEMALACHWRIASDGAATQIGLPETGIGTIPGWGGSVRLPRLIGAPAALDHILKAQLAGAAAAGKAGLVHEVVPAAELKARASASALRLAAAGKPEAVVPPATTPEYFQTLRTSLLKRTRGQQPALIAAVDAVEKTERLPIDEALEIEARIFAEVTVSEVCRNLVHVFFLRDAAKKRTLEGWFPNAEPARAAVPQRSGERQPGHDGLNTTPSPIKRVGVVGAGVMGSGIAHWLATRGFDVVMRDVQPELIERGLAVIRRLFDEAVKRGKLSAGEANGAMHRITTTIRWEGFESCDLVIEAIVENTEAKRQLFSELAGVVREDTLLASNTSALPLEEIAGHVPNPGRTVGIHFFNPVSRMALVELIIGPQTSADSAERALALVKSLGKSPIVCRSSPGFLVTRVLFFYLNAAIRLWEQGALTESVDTAMRDFGWPMGPLRLIDEVGVDVTDFIFGELAHYFPARFARSEVCARMLTAGLKGRKNGASAGFYRYVGGQEIVNDADTRRLAGSPGGTTSASSVARAEAGPPPNDSISKSSGSRSEICAHLMRVMVEEAKRCLDEGVVKSSDEVDFALLNGAGFPAFRGGLMHWARNGSR